MKRANEAGLQNFLHFKASLVLTAAESDITKLLNIGKSHIRFVIMHLIGTMVQGCEPRRLNEQKIRAVIIYLPDFPKTIFDLSVTLSETNHFVHYKFSGKM